MRILLATTNAGKIAELRRFLTDEAWEVIGLGDLTSTPPPVEETGNTFLENALLKADYYHLATGELTLADDSGLEVFALGGRPGVQSARYGGTDLDDTSRNALLLEEMRGVPEASRGAQFACLLALVGNGVRKTFSGACEGRLADAPAGSQGFGYDPIFLDVASGRTFAELSPGEKLGRSHRGEALSQLVEYLRQLRLHESGS
jgi:XTP/dITP diphosphohydrolase